MPTNYSNRLEYTSEDLYGNVTRMRRVFEDCGVTIKRSREGYIWEIRNEHSFGSAEEALKDAMTLLKESSLEAWEPIYTIARRVKG